MMRSDAHRAITSWVRSRLSTPTQEDNLTYRTGLEPHEVEMVNAMSKYNERYRNLGADDEGGEFAV